MQQVLIIQFVPRIELSGVNITVNRTKFVPSVTLQWSGISKKAYDYNVVIQITG